MKFNSKYNFFKFILRNFIYVSSLWDKQIYFQKMYQGTMVSYSHKLYLHLIQNN